MLRPFPFVMIAATGLLILKAALNLADTPVQVAGIDPIATGSTSKRALQKLNLEPIYQDDKTQILVRSLNALSPREAAKIFSNFDDETQIEVSSKLSPLVFADILSQLTPEKALSYTKALNADMQANKQANK